MKSLFRFIFLLFGIVCLHQVATAQSDLEILRKRVTDEMLHSTIHPEAIQKRIATLQPDGSWPDINYKDLSRTGFQNDEHLRHLVAMSQAYKQAGSPLEGNKDLKKAIDLALNFWLRHDFICENWWNNQIGTPNALVAVLLIMDDELSAWQVEHLLPIVGRANLHASGARPSGDRIKIAGILAKRLLFERDTAALARVMQVIEGEIKFTTGRGLQYDYSFHHREDRVNNTLSYGTQYANVFAQWAARVSGTRYQFSQHSIETLVDYYLDGICKMMVYGKFPDPGAKNRAITRKGSLRAYGPGTPEALLKVTDYRKAELKDIVAIRKGEKTPSLSFSRFYWQSEHFTFQRPGFFTSVRMYSIRCDNMEQPYNGEGLMNHYRGDGTNYISRTGTEYDYLSPVYDWRKIPGATIVQHKEMPPANEIQKKGRTTFVGAVTDGTYGAVGFDFKSPHDPLAARKSWFFFDSMYVCLGAGISANTPLPVATTINQSHLNGPVIATQNNKHERLQQGEHHLEQTSWVWQDSIGYIFPKSTDLYLSNQSETGSWYRVNHQENVSRKQLSKPVFTLWINHSSRPENARYQYMVAPNATAQRTQQLAERPPVQIRSNTTAIQAVENNRLHLFEAVFYQAGRLSLANGLRLEMKDPGIVMIHTTGTSVQSLSVSDPTRQLKKMHLTLSAHLQGEGKGFQVHWDDQRKVSVVSIDLPQDVYAGKSVTIKF